MKSYHIFISLLLCSYCLKAQPTFLLEAGTQLHLGNATLVIDSSDVFLDGILQAGSSTVKMSGGRNIQLASGDNIFYQLSIEKTADTKVILFDSLTLMQGLSFDAPDNKVELGIYPVHFKTNADVTGFGPDNYFITNATGQVRKADLGASPFTFPIGFDAFSYNPVVLLENGTPDLLGVRCLENAYQQGCVGTPYLEGVVDASWEITESQPGGMNLDVVVQWAAGDELPGFDRSFSGNAHYGTAGWDLTVDDCAAAMGSDPYTQQRMGLTDAGAFAVGNDSLTRKVQLEVDLLLEGPYVGSGEMADGIRAASQLPLSEPYDALGFTHHGFGGGELVLPAVFTTTGSDAIIDWVLVEIRDGADSTIIKATAPALLQKDGDIVDLDGSSPLSIPGIGMGEYFVAIKHRNHLGVMTAGKLTLSSSSSAYDFTTNVANTFGGALGIADLGDGRYGLVSGDFNHNGQVQNTDVSLLIPTIGNSGYLQGDLDMNAQVQNTDLQLQLIPNIGKGAQFDY